MPRGHLSTVEMALRVSRRPCCCPTHSTLLAPRVHRFLSLLVAFRRAPVIRDISMNTPTEGVNNHTLSGVLGARRLQVLLAVKDMSDQYGPVLGNPRREGAFEGQEGRRTERRRRLTLVLPAR